MPFLDYFAWSDNFQMLREREKVGTCIILLSISLSCLVLHLYTKLWQNVCVGII